MLNRIFVPLEDTKTAEALLIQAFSFAKNLVAHVDVLRVVSVQRPRISNPLLTRWPIVGGISNFPFIDQASMPEIQSYIKRYQDEVEGARKEYREIFNKACKDFGITKLQEDDDAIADKTTASWIEHPPAADGSGLVLKQALVSDICVATRPAEEENIWLSPVVHNILFNAAKPLILLPAEVKGQGFRHLPKNIAIAWNGSNESSHAVSASMPFIKAAEKVTIFTYSSKKTNPSDADDVEKWLAFHGVATDKIVFDKIEVTSVGASLVAEVAERKFDLLIAGAYGHSRMREFVLGGVTTYLLANCSIPLFMAH